MDDPCPVLPLPLSCGGVPDDKARVDVLCLWHAQTLHGLGVPVLKEDALARVEHVGDDVLLVVPPVQLLVTGPLQDIYKQLAEVVVGLMAPPGVDHRLGVQDARHDLVDISPDNIGDEGHGPAEVLIFHVLELIRGIVVVGSTCLVCPLARLLYSCP